MFEKTFEFCAVGMAHVGLDGRFIRVNKKLSEFLGYEKKVLIKKTFQEITVDTHLDQDLALLDNLIEGKIENYVIEKQYIHADGHNVWGKLTVSAVRDSTGKPELFVSVIEDIDDRKRLEAELFQAEALFSKIVSAFSERTFIWVSTPNLSKLHYVNGGYKRIFGRSDYELYSNPCAFLAYVHEEDKHYVEDAYFRRPLSNWDLEYRVIDSVGNTKYLHDRGSVLFDPENKQVLLLGTSDDVTHEKQQQYALLEAVRKLEHLSKTDGLTNLINRRELFEQLSEEIHRMQRTKSPSTLVYFDLDNFKQINDKYGHQVGDKALKVFADITTSALRETDILGRVGGDEFILLLFDTGFDDATIFMNRLAETPYHIPVDKEETITLSMSIGKATWDESITTVQQWIELADSAMYTEKRQRHEGATTT